MLSGEISLRPIKGRQYLHHKQKQTDHYLYPIVPPPCHRGTRTPIYRGIRIPPRSPSWTALLTLGGWKGRIIIRKASPPPKKNDLVVCISPPPPPPERLYHA